MYVKDHMVAKPQCIIADTVVSKALDIMAQNNFHRLPVVDEGGRLIGLITEGLVSEASGAKSTSLSMYELNYLLSRTKVGDIMVTDVKTIGPDALVEEAATKMRSEEISVLPVVDADNKVIGIITENDIFDAFIVLLGYRQAGTRFVIHISKDAPGILRDIADIFSKEGISLSTLSVYTTVRGIEIVILAKADCAEFEDKLKAAGWDVTDVRRQSGN